MDIVRLVEVKILSVMEVITRVLEGGTDYLDFERQLKKELDGLGCELLQIVLESLDQKLKTS
ncbi:MAG: ISLre2 family transposase, partial [Dethiobacteria bacterium]